MNPFFVSSRATIVTASAIGILFMGLYALHRVYDGDLIVALCRGNYRVACEGNYLAEELQLFGSRAALHTFASLYEKNPTFAKECHIISHQLGWVAYETSHKGKDVMPRPEFSYCSFGFYHGFLEALVADSGNPRGAREWCSDLESKITDGRSVLGPCLHGFGHGITDGRDLSKWGDPLALIAPGLSLCRTLGNTDEEKKLCAGGVFNALAFMYAEKRGAIALDPNNPYAICDAQQEKPFREACFRNLQTAIDVLYHNHFLKAARATEKTTRLSDASSAINSLATYQAHLMTARDDDFFSIAMCMRLSPAFRNSCISGFATGLMLFAPPGSAIERTLAFCGRNELSDIYRSSCYDAIIYSSKIQYGNSAFANACALVPSAYASRCISSASGAHIP